MLNTDNKSNHMGLKTIVEQTSVSLKMTSTSVHVSHFVTTIV
jgi:hypothetical protein